jgi:GT2 family glycosyltransferase
VIVVTHNNEAFVGDCLRNIATSFAPGSCEIIVVDNASSDQTTAIVRAHPSHPQLIELESNLGFADATNTGINASRGRFNVLVNSDAFPDPGSIDALIRALDELPGAGIIGARLRYPTGALQPSVGRFPSLLGGLWVALFLHRAPFTARLNLGINAHPALYSSRRQVDWVTAAFCIARREAGPLPVRRFMYGEDVEWARACREVGLEVWFEPLASGVHTGRASVDHSQERGFAQRRWGEFELAWFARRGPAGRAAARAVLVLHALLRLSIYAGVAAIRLRRDRRVREYLALLQVALSHRPREG